MEFTACMPFAVNNAGNTPVCVIHWETGWVVPEERACSLGRAQCFYPLGWQWCGVVLQKVAFWRLKGGLLQPQRLPFAV